MANLPVNFGGLTSAHAAAVEAIAEWRYSALAGVRVAASGSAVDDPAALLAAMYAAGPGGTVSLEAGRVYLFGTEVTIPHAITLRGNGAVLRVPQQVYTTLSSAATINAAAAAVSVELQVVSSAGFWIGQRVALEDQTVGGQITKSRIRGTVTAVTAGRVTVQFANSAGDPIAVTSPLATWLETTSVNYTWSAGTYLCSVSSVIRSGEGIAGVRLLDLEIDGNMSNSLLGRRWETAPLLDIRSGSSVVADTWLHDAPTDAIYWAAVNSRLADVRISKTAAMGIHFGAATAVQGAQGAVCTGLLLDSPGMGDPTIGHCGGYNSSHPAYPAIGCSRITDHIIVQGGRITNDYGTSGTFGTAISCITAGDNWALQFNDLHISGFNKGLGPLLLVRSSQAGGYTSTPTDPPGDNKQAPQAISFNRVRFDSCYPPTFATADQWQMCCVGANSGTFPQLVRVTFADCEWLDSPMTIQEAQVEFSGVNEFVATAVARSATLTINGTTADVDISGCVFRRPVTTSGTIGSAPGWYQYSCNLYLPGGKTRGTGVSIIGGHIGVRVQNSAELDLAGLYAQNQYSYSIVAMNTAKVSLRASKFVLQSGFTGDSGWAAVHANSGAGVLASGGSVNLTACDVDAVTTYAGQACVKLPPGAGALFSVIASRLKVSGTSTVPVASGGAAGVGVVAANLLSHAFIPGAAETSTHNVVSSNL